MVTGESFVLVDTDIVKNILRNFVCFCCQSPVFPLVPEVSEALILESPVLPRMVTGESFVVE